MKRLLFLLLLIPTIVSAQTVHHRQFGVATTVPFILYNTDGTLDVDEVDGGTEVSLGCDEGAETTATNDFVDEGTTYSIALTAAEMECARLTIVVAATDTNVAIVETFGDYRAQDRARGVASGTAQASTSTTIVFESDTAIGADDILIGRTVCITEGTGKGQCRLITDFANATDTATVATWDTTPSTDSGYIVLPGNQASTTTVANAVADQVWDEAQADHTTAGTFGETASETAAILVDTGTTLDARQQAINSNTSYNIITAETADSGTTTTVVDADSLAGLGDDLFNNGAAIYVEISTGVEGRCVTDYISASNQVTVFPAFSTAVSTETYTLVADPGCRNVWDEVVEDQGTQYNAREVLSVLLSEAAGTCVYNSTTRVWTCKDPGSNETRLVITMGSELDGDRDSVTLTPVTP